MKLASVALLLAAACLLPLTASGDTNLVVPIQVSPNVIAIRSQGTCLTIHADILYRLVVPVTVELKIDDNEPMQATGTFADDRGQLVAKFSLGKVKSQAQPPSAVMTLTGMTTQGQEFSGQQTVAVK